MTFVVSQFYRSYNGDQLTRRDLGTTDSVEIARDWVDRLNGVLDVGGFDLLDRVRKLDAGATSVVDASYSYEALHTLSPLPPAVALGTWTLRHEIGLRLLTAMDRAGRPSGAIQTIKWVREQVPGTGLKEAKDEVDAVWDGLAACGACIWRSIDARLAYEVKLSHTRW